MACIAAEVERAYGAIRRGGLAIVKADIGYSFAGHSEASIRKMYELKGRPVWNPCIVIGNRQVLDEVGHIEDQRLLRWVEEQMAWTTLAVVVPLREGPLWRSLAPWVRGQSSNNGTVAVYLNTGTFTDLLVERAHRDGRALVGSSGNRSFQGNNFRPEEVPPEFVEAAEYFQDLGVAKYENPERVATTIVDLTTMSIHRRGVNADPLEARFEALRGELLGKADPRGAFTTDPRQAKEA